MLAVAAFMEGRELARRGEVVGGKYRVDHVIGSGGMGLVVAATHLQLKSRVAIKFLLARGKASEGPLARSLPEPRSRETSARTEQCSCQVSHRQKTTYRWEVLNERNRRGHRIGRDRDEKASAAP
jgi:hypothetical protein